MNIEFLKSIKKEKRPVNGRAVLLHEQKIHWTYGGYHCLTEKDYKFLKPFLIISTDIIEGTFYICKLIPYKNDESWPFNSIYLTDENGKTNKFQLDLEEKYKINEFHLGFIIPKTKGVSYLDCLDNNEPKVEPQITSCIYENWKGKKNAIILNAINKKMNINKKIKNNWEKKLDSDSEITNVENLTSFEINENQKRTINSEAEYISNSKKPKKDTKTHSSFVSINDYPINRPEVNEKNSDNELKNNEQHFKKYKKFINKEGTMDDFKNFLEEQKPSTL